MTVTTREKTFRVFFTCVQLVNRGGSVRGESQLFFCVCAENFESTGKLSELKQLSKMVAKNTPTPAPCVPKADEEKAEEAYKMLKQTCENIIATVSSGASSYRAL